MQGILYLRLHPKYAHNELSNKGKPKDQDSCREGKSGF